MKIFGKKPDDGDTHDYELEQVLEIAAEGRKLAIYDRATKLYAYWYLQLRGDEEIARAKRYNKSLCILSLWSPEAMIPLVATHLREGLRDHDLAAYLNNGHFVVLLSETDASGAAVVMDRLEKRAGKEVAGGVAMFPDDGLTFDELLEIAKRRASDRAGDSRVA